MTKTGPCTSKKWQLWNCILSVIWEVSKYFSKFAIEAKYPSFDYLPLSKLIYSRVGKDKTFLLGLNFSESGELNEIGGKLLIDTIGLGIYKALIWMKFFLVANRQKQCLIISLVTQRGDRYRKIQQLLKYFFRNRKPLIYFLKMCSSLNLAIYWCEGAVIPVRIERVIPFVFSTLKVELDFFWCFLESEKNIKTFSPIWKLFSMQKRFSKKCKTIK